MMFLIPVSRYYLGPIPPDARKAEAIPWLRTNRGGEFVGLYVMGPLGIWLLQAGCL